MFRFVIIVLKEVIVLLNVGFRIYFEDKTVFVDKNSLAPVKEKNTTVYLTTVEGVKIKWCFEHLEKGDIITLFAKGEKALGIKRIDSAVFNIGVPEKTDRIAFIGRAAMENETRFAWELASQTEYIVDCLAHLKNMTAAGPVFAGVSPFHDVYKSCAFKNEDESFTFCAKTEFTEGALELTELKTERVLLCESVTLDEFFDIFRALLPTSKFDMPKLTGWNSWDYYLDKVTAEDIMENAEALGKTPFADKLDYIVIDDGWQKGWGVWTENEKFACGLKTVADSIIKAGFKPGIWMTPVGIRKDVPIFEEHKDWLCRDEKGELLYDMGLYYLDPTHPEAEKFIMDNYRYQYDAGYRLFKMDYVSPLLNVKSFYDKNATAYSALSKMVERVKECTGPDAVVLGCSLPLECGPDVAPAMRISIDIHNFFPHVELITQAMQWSWLFNNKITRIDPDFLVVRGEQTSDDDELYKYYAPKDRLPIARYKQTDRERMRYHWCNGEMFSAIEAQTWANLVAISGGNIFLSDRISRLNALGIDIIDKAFALAGNEVRPVFLKDDKRIASVWKGDKGMLIVNWDDIPKEFNVDGVSVTLLPHESHAVVYGG